jgi:outer membrane protein OmpA-like peptidoglycan-associated protein
MKKYPKLIVESGSHTDSRGPDRYNDILSDKRAKSTVDYIISKGISPDRISGKGYGERQLTNGCSNGVRCTEEQHQLNRRTEFVIVNPEVIN